MELTPIVGIVVGVCAISAVNLYRRQKVKGVAEELGLEFLPKLDIRDELDGCDLFMNSGVGPKCIPCFGGQANEIEFKIFANRFSIGNGKRQKVHSQTVAYINLPHGDMPDFQVKTKDNFSRMLSEPNNSFEVNDPAFGKKFWTCSTQAAKAKGLFTEEVKALIQSNEWSVEVSRGRLLIYRLGNKVGVGQLKDFLIDSLLLMMQLESALKNPAIPAFLLVTPGPQVGSAMHS